MSVKVILTAGGAVPEALAPHADGAAKALLRVGGRSLLEQALAAAEQCASCADIVVAGPEEVARRLAHPALHVPAGATIVDNIQRAFDRHGADRDAEYLILSPDLPFVEADALGELIETARAAGSGIALPVVSRADFLSRFPGAGNRFERLDGGEVTLGSAAYLTGAMLATNIPLLRDFFRFRKAPLKLAALLGLPVAAAYLSGRLTTTALQRRFSALCGGAVHGLPVRNATLAFDVDTVENYEYAVRSQDADQRVQ